MKKTDRSLLFVMLLGLGIAITFTYHNIIMQSIGLFLFAVSSSIFISRGDE